MTQIKMNRRRFLSVSAMAATAFALDWTRIADCEARMGDKKNYPTVIIGAGLGGLCCGAYLARQGIPVTVLEQHDIPGGYASSFQRDGGRFDFEVSLHGCAAKGGAVQRILTELGVDKKLDWVELPEVYRLKEPGLDIRVPQKNPKAYIEELSKIFPSQQKGIQGFVEEMLAIHAEVDKLHFKKGKFFKLFFPLQYPKMWAVRKKTLAELLDEYVTDPGCANALAALCGYFGLPPSKLSAFYYANATGSYLKNGSYYVKSRSQTLSDALAGVIEDNGGKVLCGKKAESILVEDGSVKAVKDDEGNLYPARAVASNASAPETLHKMLTGTKLPSSYAEKLGTYKASVSTFIVWLGLNQSVRGRVKGASTHVGTGRSLDETFKFIDEGALDKAGFSVTIFDNIYEGYSAPGTSTIMLLSLCGYKPWEKYQKDYDAGRKTDYNKEKDKWTEMLIRRAEEHVLPGLGKMIDVCVSATPLTNIRYTGNTGGAIYGYAQDMNNSYMNRIKNTTPVKGLYLASAWGNPGGGFEGALRGGESAFMDLMDYFGG